jgi:integrase
MIPLEPGTTKNKEARAIPLTTELVTLLTRLRRERDEYFLRCPWVFSSNGQRIGQFFGSWKSACTKAGLATEDGKPMRVFHDLRRTAITNLVRAGVPELVATRVSGHKTRAVLDRYNIINDQDLKNAAVQLDQYLNYRVVEGSG